MCAVDKDLIMRLRNASQAGFSDCKKALDANNNDIEASIKWLREKGIAKANNKGALENSGEGGLWVDQDERGAVILQINSETDFTANSKEFRELSSNIAKTILLAGEFDFGAMEGLIMANGETIKNNCLHLSSITGERIVFSRAKYVSSSDHSLAVYRHNNGRIATLLVFDKPGLNQQDINGFAVHYAANNPKHLTIDSVDKGWLKSEEEIIRGLLEKEGKPKEFHAKIIEQRLRKVTAQDTFYEQPYLYDGSRLVKDMLGALGIDVIEAIHWSL